MKRIILAVYLCISSISTWAQSGGIQGRVLNEKGQGEGFVTVVLVSDEKGSNPTRPVQTNIDGFYSIKPLSPGKYNVMVRYFGYETEIESGIQVNANQMIEVKFKLEKKASKNLNSVTIKVKKFEKKIIDAGEPGIIVNMTSTEIKQLATRDVGDIAASQGGVYQEDAGSGLSIAGSRGDGVQVMIDGMKVSGSAKLPPNAIGQLQVLTGGIPARYGDVSGGVINITTKDPPKKFAGSIEGITSQYLDPWGYNLGNVSLSGPLWKKKDSINGVLVEKVKIGYLITGEFQTQKDRNPTYNGLYKIKDSAYQAIKDNPYQFTKDGSRIIQTAELINGNDLEKTSYHQNNSEWQARAQAKLEFKISDEFGLTMGGGFDMNRYHTLVQRYQLFNFENNPVHFDRTMRGFARFRHNIGAGKNTSSSSSSSNTNSGTSVENAFYTLQVDFEKINNEYYDEDHGFNYMNYGYIGQFERLRTKNVEYKSKEKVFYGPGANDFLNMEGYFVQGDKDTGVRYTPGNINPLGASVTTSYLNLVKDVDPGKYSTTLAQIEQNGGIVNGNRSGQFIHGLYYPFARQFGGAGRDADNEQYRVRFDGSFDISSQGKGQKNTHAIEFGLEYEQRILRSYTIAPLSLWRLASIDANSHIARDVKDFNPMLSLNSGSTHMTLQEYVKQIKNGVDTAIFYFTDTIEYGLKANSKTETRFSKNIRKELNLDPNGTDFVQVDMLDPTQIKLNYFSPDELLDNWGLTGVRYNGYDIYGNRLSGTPSFNDFFKKRNSNGDFSREVGAYKPIYMAGYVQDKFQFKDLTFIVGVRVDRFDANQKVLKDKYSVYGVSTIGNKPTDGKLKFTAPGNLSNDAVIYVDKAINPTRVTGYRQGDFWYDVNGNLIASPAAISSASGGVVQPYLLQQENGDRVNNMTDSLYNPESSFTDYSPIWNVMPRLQFSFPLVKDANGDPKSLFFAHYDVLAQRPSGDGFSGLVGVLYASPFDYYMTFGKNFSSFVNNANLRAQRTIDFEMGFKQTLSKTSVVTIATFYREYRDQIQYTKIVGAYPKDYFTFANIDFSTSKGMKVDYEMRPTKTSNLRLKVGYTLSFAEGTGSDVRTQFSIVEGGNTNVKLINPLNYDARHNLVISADYRFFSENYNGPQGKVIKGILQDLGININANLRSGTPYTQQGNPTADASLTTPSRPFNSGSINGARMPMRFNVNMKIDKSFIVKLKKKEGQDKPNVLDFNVYLQIKNLLNTGNVLSVYRYTGNPDDDGYLTSPVGSNEVIARESELSGRGQSFYDLYKIALEMPNARTSFYSQPRTIQLGVNFNF